MRLRLEINGSLLLLLLLFSEVFPLSFSEVLELSFQAGLSRRTKAVSEEHTIEVIHFVLDRTGTKSVCLDHENAAVKLWKCRLHDVTALHLSANFLDAEATFLISHHSGPIHLWCS